MKKQKVDVYQHVRNKDCIYRRIGDTTTFAWKNYKRSEAGLIADLDEKFKPYVEDVDMVKLDI